MIARIVIFFRAIAGSIFFTSFQDMKKELEILKKGAIEQKKTASILDKKQS